MWLCDEPPLVYCTRQAASADTCMLHRSRYACLRATLYVRMIRRKEEREPLRYQVATAVQRGVDGRRFFDDDICSLSVDKSNNCDICVDGQFLIVLFLASYP